MSNYLTTQNNGIARRPDAREERQVAAVRRQTRLRMEWADGEACAAVTKLRAIDYAVDEAMAGHAVTMGFAKVYSAGDPLMTDEMRFFVDRGMLAKGAVIAGMVFRLDQEGRR